MICCILSPWHNCFSVIIYNYADKPLITIIILKKVTECTITTEFEAKNVVTNGTVHQKSITVFTRHKNYAPSTT